MFLLNGFPDSGIWAGGKRMKITMSLQKNRETSKVIRFKYYISGQPVYIKS